MIIVRKPRYIDLTNKMSLHRVMQENQEGFVLDFNARSQILLKSLIGSGPTADERL